MVLPRVAVDTTTRSTDWAEGKATVREGEVSVGAARHPP